LAVAVPDQPLTIRLDFKVIHHQ
jgi:hypothetical protein